MRLFRTWCRFLATSFLLRDAVTHLDAAQDFREFGNALAFLQCLSEVTSGLDCLKFVHTVPVMGLSSSKKWDPKRTRLVAATTALTRGSDVPGAAGGVSSICDQFLRFV